MFCCILILSTMTASDSLTLVNATSFPYTHCLLLISDTLVKRRVYQVALMSFGACRLSYPGENADSPFPMYRITIVDFAHKDRGSSLSSLIITSLPMSLLSLRPVPSHSALFQAALPGGLSLRIAANDHLLWQSHAFGTVRLVGCCRSPNFP
jgi:hypothetical protein